MSRRPEGSSRREFIKQVGLAGLAVAAAPRFLAGCNPPVPMNVPPWELPPNRLGIEWAQLNPFGISLGGDKWNSARVNDVLQDQGGAVVAACDAGGVWVVLADGDVAVPVSHEWDSPDVQCVAQGPDGPGHVFAGGASSVTAGEGALYETDMTQTAPLVARWAPVSVSGVGVIWRILVTADRHIVLATSNGIWWSVIPPSGSVGMGYTWFRATTPVVDGAFWGLTPGPGTSIIASAWPTRGTDVAAGHVGLLFGDWQSGPTSLSFQAATVSGTELATGGALSVSAMRRTSVDSFPGDRNQAWAVAADDTTTLPGAGDGQLYAVLRSRDGGRSWNTVRATLVRPGDPMATLRGVAGGYAGNQRNNALAASPALASTMAFGWVIGPFVTIDDGDTFALVEDAGGAGHWDYAALRWTAPNRLYACTDGGLAYTDNQGATWQSHLNRRLATLQFYSPSAARQFYGMLAVSPPAMVSTQVVTAVSGGLQDDGNVYCRVAEGGDAAPWLKTGANGDGGPTVFTSGLLIEASTGFPFRGSTWDGTTLVGTADIPGIGPGGTGTLPDSPVAPVNAPTVGADGRSMIAVAGNGSVVYGLYRAGDGTLSWSTLVTLTLPAGQFVSSVASFSGAKVFAGLRGSSTVYSFDVSNPAAAVQETGFPGTGDGGTAIARIVLLGETEGYALLTSFNDAVYTVHQRIGASGWTPTPAAGLPAMPLFCLEVDTQASPRIVFVGADNRVYARTENPTDTWFEVSRGLPNRSHVADLRIVRDPDGTRRMYASTFGRSVWRTTF